MANRNAVSVSSPDFDAETPTPTREQIASRAYELFLARGATEGHDVDDWLEAERELTERSHQYETV